MKKKKSVSFVMLYILFPVLAVLILYFVLAFYYRGGFPFGTWINGIYCTGKSVMEVNRELLADTQYPEIVLTDRFGMQSKITAEEINYSADYTGQLYDYVNRQNSFLWIDNLFLGKSNHLAPTVSYDAESMEKVIESLPIVQQEATREKDVNIIWTEEGYVLQNGMESVLDTEKLKQVVAQSLSDEIYEINLVDADCYTDLELTPQMKKTVELWKQVEAFQQCHVTYDFGGTWVPVTAGDSSLWILTDVDGSFAFDENGNLQVDEEAVAEYVSGLAMQYDTYGKTRQFTATCGETVLIEGGTYGSQMNQSKETEYLIQAFLSKVSEVHVPSYKRQPKQEAGDDIGDTYIEIDLTEQKMYYYEDGELMLETDVVTGNVKKGNSTPAGVNYVYAKQRNRILRGADYESFVRFWMPIAGNIGIHDASWRSKFGGEIYLTNGSHGCINTPYAKMKELFDMVEIGTPVVMFYHE